MTVWDTLEELRDSKRKRTGRLAFDCFNLKVRDKRVYCAKGYCLGSAKDGGLALMSALRGVTPSVCKLCKDYDGGEE